jgi:hypothetical protein
VSKRLSGPRPGRVSRDDSTMSAFLPVSAVQRTSPDFAFVPTPEKTKVDSDGSSRPRGASQPLRRKRVRHQLPDAVSVERDDEKKIEFSGQVVDRADGGDEAYVSPAAQLVGRHGASTSSARTI